MILGYSDHACRQAIRYAEQHGWEPLDVGGFDLIAKPEREALLSPSFPSLEEPVTRSDDSVSTSTPEMFSGASSPADVLASVGGADIPPAASAHTGTDTPKTAHLRMANDKSEPVDAAGDFSLTEEERMAAWRGTMEHRELNPWVAAAEAVAAPLKKRIADLASEKETLLAATSQAIRQRDEVKAALVAEKMPDFKHWSPTAWRREDPRIARLSALVAEAVETVRPFAGTMYSVLGLPDECPILPGKPGGPLATVGDLRRCAAFIARAKDPR